MSISIGGSLIQYDQLINRLKITEDSSSSILSKKTLGELEDVDINLASNGDYLYYNKNSSKWENQGSLYEKGEAQTQTDTPQELQFINMDEGQTAMLKSEVVSKKTGAAGALGCSLSATFLKNDGVISQVGITQKMINKTGHPIDTDFAIKGDNTGVQVQVVGEDSFIPEIRSLQPLPTRTGNTITVGTGQTYTNIQTAINDLDSDGTIVLLGETFNVPAGLNITKPLTILGSTGTVLNTIINVNSGGFAISGLKLTTTSPNNIAIWTGSDHIVSNVVFESVGQAMRVRCGSLQVNDCTMKSPQGFFTIESVGASLIIKNVEIEATQQTSIYVFNIYANLDGYFLLENITYKNTPPRYFMTWDPLSYQTTPANIVIKNCTGGSERFIYSRTNLSQIASLSLISVVVPNGEGTGLLLLDRTHIPPISSGTTTIYRQNVSFTSTTINPSYLTGVSAQYTDPESQATLVYNPIGYEYPDAILSELNEWNWKSTTFIYKT